MGACYNGVIDYCLEANLLITCRFLVIFLVVSGKKHNFDGKLYKPKIRKQSQWQSQLQ